MVVDSLSSSDRVELLELYARSVLLIDLERCVEWADLFVPDAVMRCEVAGEPFAAHQFHGREELLALSGRLVRGEFDLALGNLARPLRCRHLLSNIALFAAGSRHASAYAYVTVVSVGGADPPRYLASGVWRDQLRKCPAGWCFWSRRFDADGGGIALCGPRPPMAPALSDLMRP